MTLACVGQLALAGFAAWCVCLGFIIGVVMAVARDH